MRGMEGWRGFRRRRAMVAAAGAAVFLLGACGGGGGGGAELSHSELVSKATQVCQTAISKAKSLDPGSPNYLQDAINDTKQLLSGLQALHPSSADASTYTAM